MNESLILILGATPDDPVSWAFWGEGRIQLGDRAQNVSALASIADRATSARCVAAVLQGEAVAMRALPAPPRSVAQFRAAARYLLEDELAESLDHVHMGVARHVSGAGLAVAVKRSIIEDWRAALSAAGTAPDFMSADFALLPMAPGQAVVVETDDRMIASIGLQGFSADRPLADDIVAALLADEAISEISVYGPRTIELTDRDNVSVDWKGPLTGEGLLSLFAGSIDNGATPNLLQGEFRKSRDWRAAAGPWRRAAMLAAGLCAGLLLTGIADSVRSLRVAEQLQSDTLALHRAAFPDAGESDPRAHARQVLASGGGRPVFLQISNAIAESLEEHSDIQLDRIRYNAVRDEYAVNLRFTDIARLEALKRALESRGIVATEAGGVLRSGGFYVGELKVSLS